MWNVNINFKKPATCANKIGPLQVTVLLHSRLLGRFFSSGLCFCLHACFLKALESFSISNIFFNYYTSIKTKILIRKKSNHHYSNTQYILSINLLANENFLLKYGKNFWQGLPIFEQKSHPIRPVDCQGCLRSKL